MSLDSNTDYALKAADTRLALLTSGNRRTPPGKLVFDKVFAALALICLAPVLLVIALVTIVLDGRPVFYGHKRIGLAGREFRCLKFRTMRQDGDSRLQQVLRIDPIAREEWEAARKLDRDPRVSRWGQFLRKTSLDELPQLWNILRGEMSVVGPRPITADEVRYYGENIAAYKSVRPGLTGAWQVGGRSDTSYDDRVAFDVDYVRTRTFAMDLSIILRTIPVALRGRGAC